MPVFDNVVEPSKKQIAQNIFHAIILAKMLMAGMGRKQTLGEPPQRCEQEATSARKSRARRGYSTKKRTVADRLRPHTVAADLLGRHVEERPRYSED